MAAQIPSNLVDILLAVRARLITVLAFPPERVVVLARESLDQEHQANQYVLLRALGGPFDQACFDGGGRRDTRLERTCWATLRTRLTVDEPTSDLAWATDPSLGHYAREHQLFDALCGFHVTDADGNELCERPLVPKQVSAAVKDRKNASKTQEWGSSSFEFLVRYQLKLDETYQ